MASSAPNMPILIIPDTRLRSPYTVLPKLFIGDFLGLNGINAHCTEPTSISGPLRMNDVKCILQLNVKITHQDSFFETLYLHTLSMHVEVPESSGLPAQCLTSPIVTLGAFEGRALDDDAPSWTRIPPGMAFEIRQPRVGMASLTRLPAAWQSWTYVLAQIRHITTILPDWADMFGPFPTWYYDGRPGLHRIDPGNMVHSQANPPRRSSRLPRQTVRTRIKGMGGVTVKVTGDLHHEILWDLKRQHVVDSSSMLQSSRKIRKTFMLHTFKSSFGGLLMPIRVNTAAPGFNLPILFFCDPVVITHRRLSVEGTAYDVCAAHPEGAATRANSVVVVIKRRGFEAWGSRPTHLWEEDRLEAVAAINAFFKTLAVTKPYLYYIVRIKAGTISRSNNRCLSLQDYDDCRRDPNSRQTSCAGRTGRHIQCPSRYVLSATCPNGNVKIDSQTGVKNVVGVESH
ncbi:hypothetical protein FIBSPDRAFT_885452 [Athelia psychrophila]|uniref:Uncharacterized protein n=1 Tax=Athelia psychrophila TaxID=1759441 RepID=A0A166RRQ0_9AGAM|nr:hypothetical protein FIBSPDRAFT_885452 [Fibularhizoctonia sp. CBS 109695]